MNNLITYNQYLIKEEFNFFGKKDDDIADKIIEKLKNNFDERFFKKDIKWKYSYNEFEDKNDKITCSYILINLDKSKEIDPYGEEEWTDDEKGSLTLKIVKLRDPNDKHPVAYINDIKLNISNRKARKIWYLINSMEEKKARKKEEEELKNKKNEIRKKIMEDKDKKNDIRKRLV